MLGGSLIALKTKVPNQAQPRTSSTPLLTTVHVANPCSQLALKTLGQPFVLLQHKSSRPRCGLEPNKDKSHKSRTARTQEIDLKALTKFKNMAVRFSKQARHFSIGFKRGAAGKNILLHRKMQEILQKTETETSSELSWTVKRREKLRLHCKCRTTGLAHEFSATGNNRRAGVK